MRKRSCQQYNVKCRQIFFATDEVVNRQGKRINESPCSINLSHHDHHNLQIFGSCLPSIPRRKLNRRDFSKGHQKETLARDISYFSLTLVDSDGCSPNIPVIHIDVHVSCQWQ